MRHRTLWAFVSVIILLAAGACGGGEDAPATPAAPAAPAFDPATAGTVMGMISLEGAPPEPRADPHELRPGLRRAGHRDRDGVLRRRRRRRAGQRVRLRQGRPHRQLPGGHGGGGAGPAGLPLPAARLRRAGRADDRDREQRHDAAQHPRDAQRQRRVQHGPAHPGDALRADVRRARDHGALPVRRPQLDERVRGRARPPVLRGDRRRRQVRHQRAAAQATTSSRPGTRSSARRRRT